ncbi:MAG: hypothetical protein ACXWC9_04975 [Pseudobdellovibrionaceae bacterium]
MKYKKSATPVYLALLIIGFAWTLWTAFSHEMKAQEVAWFFWTASLLMSPFILLLGQAERLWRKDPSSSSAARIGLAFFGAIAGGVAIYFVHGIIGAFLSIVAEIEPVYYFGRNGFINHFELEACWILLERYWFLLPAYLTVKSSALVVSPRARMMGHGTLRDPVLILVAAMIAMFFSIQPLFSLLAFGFVFFAPWTLIVSKDITAKRRDHEPDLAPEPRFPIEFLDRGSRFWGTFITGFGLIFLLLGIWFPIFMTSKNGSTVGAVIASLVFFLAFAGFAALAMLFGLTMLLQYRRIRIDGGTVRCEQRTLKPWPKTSQWQESLSFYKLQKDRIQHRDSDGINYDEYLVILKHTAQPERNITLYRAYHQDGWEERLQAWQSLMDPHSR